MKKFICLLAAISILSGCKKSNDGPAPILTAMMNAPVVFKKLKTMRTVNSYGNFTDISNYTYIYNGNGLMTSVNAVDSSFGGFWSVTTSSWFVEYNGSNRIVKEYVQGMTSVIDYVYDSNGKVQYEISSSGGSVDTVEYTHTGINSISKPKYPGASSFISYYTNGDEDSSHSTNNNVVVSRDKYTYSNKKDLSSAYFDSYLPLSPYGKEVTSYANTYSGGSNTTSYSYTYDNLSYPIKVVVTNISQTQTVSTYTNYYSYY